MSTQHMSELNNGAGADVEIGVAPLVKFINKLGFETVSSGNDISMAFVQFRGKSHEEVNDFLYVQVLPMVAHLAGQVTLTSAWVEGRYDGAILINPLVLEEVTKRFGCWTEMLHK